MKTSNTEPPLRETLREVGQASLPRARRTPRHPPPPPRLRKERAAQESRPRKIVGEPRLARDLMTRQLLTIGPRDAIRDLAEHMEALRFGHLPVVEGNVLVGLITRADLLHAAASRLSKSAPAEDAVVGRLPASRIMRRSVVTVRPTEALERVAALLWETRAGCVPVTEDDGTLVGIITAGDFVRLAHHFLTAAGESAPRATRERGPLRVRAGRLDLPE
jgi:acetoin utilization protein AcuB